MQKETGKERLAKSFPLLSEAVRFTEQGDLSMKTSLSNFAQCGPAECTSQSVVLQTPSAITPPPHPPIFTSRIGLFVSRLTARLSYDLHKCPHDLSYSRTISHAESCNRITSRENSRATVARLENPASIQDNVRPLATCNTTLAWLLKTFQR